ncbi:MAG: hypothetical protein ACREI3_04250 [Nitrospirales bacterium]
MLRQSLRLSLITAWLGLAWSLAVPGVAFPAGEVRGPEGPSILWPASGTCLFVGLVYGGPDPTEYAFKPLRNEPASCSVQADIKGNALVLILEPEHLRVEISMPDQVGWKHLHYFWGSRHTLLDTRHLPVRFRTVAER